jgi:GNAT superfamily N-acetyltransferase
MEKYVLSTMRDKNFSRAANEIYLLTDYNKLQYPEYYKWYYQTNIPRILDGEGEAIFYLDGFQIVGLSMLKRTDDEAKICTFFIDEDYRKRGYSSLLLEDSFGYLGTESPIITIPENRLDEFSKIIEAYGWVPTETTDEYYSPEVVFNDPKVLIKKYPH